MHNRLTFKRTLDLPIDINVSEIFDNNQGIIKKDCIIAYEPIWSIGTVISADIETIK